MAYQIGYGITGLDGALEIETGYIFRDNYEQLIAKVVRPIAQHLGMPWRVVDETECWAMHPVKT